MTTETASQVYDLLGLNPDERASFIAQGIVRLFVRHPDLFGWRDPVADEALRLAKLALAAATNERAKYEGNR